MHARHGTRYFTLNKAVLRSQLCCCPDDGGDGDAGGDDGDDGGGGQGVVMVITVVKIMVRMTISDSYMAPATGHAVF